jgi:membrane protein
MTIVSSHTNSQSPEESTLSAWWKLAKKAASAWINDYAPSMGAALSYYSVFSMAPLLLIIISIAGLIFGEEAVKGELFGQLRGLLGADGASAVEGLLASVSQPAEGVLATTVGVVVLLVGATSVFGELQDALDRIWRAPGRDSTGGLWALLRARLLSFGMILGIAFLLMISLVLSAAVAAMGKWWSGALGAWEVIAQVVNFAVGFLLTTGVFAMIYKIMPRVSVRWHDVWLGAIVTSLLFTIGRLLIGLYIGKSGVTSGFGAAGSLIVIFVWVYYSAQIFLIGAEFTWVYATTFGSMRSLPGDSGEVSAEGNLNDAEKSSSKLEEPPATTSTPNSQGGAFGLKQRGGAANYIYAGLGVGVFVGVFSKLLLRRSKK